jgi:recombination protein RecA
MGVALEIEDVLAKLDPKTRKRFIAASEVEIVKQPSPSVGMNVGLNGGFAYGRQIMVYGNKSAGKSSFCLEMAGQAQKAGKTVAWMDVEKTFDPEWAAKLGADPEQILYSDASNASHVTNSVVDLLDAEVDVIIVDSISSMLSAVYFEKDGDELKGLENTKQIGADAKDMGNAVKMWNYANKNTLLVLVSQIRNKITPTYTKPDATGGYATRFYSTTVIKLWSSEAENSQIKGGLYVGDRIIEQPTGRTVNWTIENNKTGRQFVTGKYDFYYAGDHIGIDKYGDIIDVAEMYGLVQKSGNWYIFNDEKVNGRSGMVKRLRENSDEFHSLEKEVYDACRVG